MRALVHQQFGEPADVLTVTDVPDPTPGPGDVLVRLLLSPMHNHDLLTVQGTYGFKPSLPARAGTEAVGVVEALGDGVQGLEVGQRVVSGGTFGIWAELFTAPASALIPVPDAIEDGAAAQLVSMPFSAISLLESLSVEPGQWIVQNTANGAVGRMLAQFAAARGVRVLGLVRRGAGVEELAGQGIGDVVATDDPQWRERAAEILGDAKPVAGVDSVGGRASADVLSLLGDAATLVVFGAMGAPILEIPSGALIFKQAVVRGFWGSKVSAEMDPVQRGRLFGEILTRVTSGEVTLPVASVHSLEDVAGAVAAHVRPGRIGKVLFRP